VRDLGLRDATDREIYDAARAAGAVVITKDRDFPSQLRMHRARSRLNRRRKRSGRKKHWGSSSSVVVGARRRPSLGHDILCPNDENL